MELPWPDLDDWPAWGATATRKVFDEAVARLAQRRGAQLYEGVTVTGPRVARPVRDPRGRGHAGATPTAARAWSAPRW